MQKRSPVFPHGAFRWYIHRQSLGMSAVLGRSGRPRRLITLRFACNPIADDSRLVRDNHHQAKVDDVFAEWDTDPLQLLSLPDLGM